MPQYTERPDTLAVFAQVISDFVVSFDSEEKFEFANGVFEAWLGRTSDELSGCSAREIFGEAYGACKPHIDSILCGRLNHIETTLEIAARGLLKALHCHLMPLKDRHGRNKGFFVVGSRNGLNGHKEWIDKTVSERTQEILRSQLFLNSVVENIPNMIFVKDAVDLKFVQLNKAGEELIGLPREAMIGKNDYDFFPPNEAAFFVANDREVLRSKRLRDIPEESLQTANSGTRYLHTKKIPILNSDGTPEYLLGISEDITERKFNEEQHRKALETERLYRESQTLNHVKDEFLATLSHELRSPLNVICGHAELLIEEAKVSKRVLASAEVIYRNAKLQTQIIDDLLDISSIIMGKLKFHPELLNIKEILSAQTDSAKKAAERRSQTLVIDLEVSDIFIFADPTRMSQIVSNLLSNAIKFTPTGGTITVRSFKQAGQFVIEVQDSGCGIEKAFLPFVFDRFRQEDASITRKFGGLGLGLSIVRQLTEMHNGTAEAFSEGKNKGSRFTIRLPIVESTIVDVSVTELNSGSLAAKAVPPRPLNGVQILLVDDSEDGRMLFERMLNRSGANVICVDCPEAARAALAGVRPDVIVSDIGMPGEDGYSFIQKLREDPLTKTIPAIAMTAYVRGEEIERAIHAGFQAHIPKPASYHHVVDAVLQLLESQQHQ